MTHKVMAKTREESPEAIFSANEEFKAIKSAIGKLDTKQKSIITRILIWLSKQETTILNNWKLKAAEESQLTVREIELAIASFIKKRKPQIIPSQPNASNYSL
ncbi:MAG: hypothetical protein ABII23_01465 [bacterium]